MIIDTYSNKRGHSNKSNPPGIFDEIVYRELKERHRNFVEELDEGLSLGRDDISEILEDYLAALKNWRSDMDCFERENNCSIHRKEIIWMKRGIDNAITNILSGVR
jgi:hypothetical protein